MGAGMAEKQTCAWTGASGKSYTYYVHEFPPNFSEGQDGNYIFAKVNQSNQWVPIYIGEGDLSSRCTDQHHQFKCIKSKGATHVHAHKNTRESDRHVEETDLLAAYPQAYAPTGCNIKEGG